MKETSYRIELLTVDELAAFLKVKKDWVYQRVHAGNLPFEYLKVGNFLRFPVSGVQKFIESQTK
jgi:excisionase family DNA binding protein